MSWCWFETSTRAISFAVGTGMRCRSLLGERTGDLRWGEAARRLHPLALPQDRVGAKHGPLPDHGSLLDAAPFPNQNVGADNAFTHNRVAPHGHAATQHRALDHGLRLDLAPVSEHRVPPNTCFGAYLATLAHDPRRKELRLGVRLGARGNAQPVGPELLFDNRLYLAVEDVEIC